MDLILWRHAEAEEQAAAGDGHNSVLDLQRCLTPKGHQQAVQMARWLDRQLIDKARVLVSPAVRCAQTAAPLGRNYKVCDELASTASADDLLALVNWPAGQGAVLLVGHQPTLSKVVMRVLGLSGADLSFRKGSVWWLRSRYRDALPQTEVLAVRSPELL